MHDSINGPIVRVVMCKGEKGDKGASGTPDPGSVTYSMLAEDAKAAITSAANSIGTAKVTADNLTADLIPLASLTEAAQNQISRIFKNPDTSDVKVTATTKGGVLQATLAINDGAVHYDALDTALRSMIDHAQALGLSVFNVMDSEFDPDEETDNDSPRLNKAFQKANAYGGGIVFLPPGTYKIKSSYVEFYSNTMIIGVPGATVLTYDASLMDYFSSQTDTTLYPDGVGDKYHSPQSLLRNKTTKTQGGYSATHDVVIYGITFDGGDFPKKSTHLGVGHAQNIVIDSCVFKNQHSNSTSTHYLELNACRNAVVRNCRFEPEWHYAFNMDYATKTSDGTTVPDTAKRDSQYIERVYAEYINLDAAKSGAYGAESYYLADGTQCDNIEICNCYFESYGTAELREKAISSVTACELSVYAKVASGDWKPFVLNKQVYYGMAIGGHWSDTTKGWENHTNVRIHDNVFYGDWNMGKIRIGPATTDNPGLPMRRYTINANYMTGDLDYWDIYDNVFRAKTSRTTSDGDSDRTPCGILLNTRGTHNSIHDNMFYNYDAGQLLYHGTAAPTSASARYWNNVNLAYDGTVTVKGNLPSPVE